MKFRDYFSKKQLFFALFIFIILIPIALWQSSNLVKVSFNSEHVNISSSKYSMSIRYNEIASAELVDLAEAGEKVQDGYDDDLIRTGVWKNNTWGEYTVCVDLDATQCIVAHLDDGRIFVFNRKNNETTADLFETLQTYLAE